MQREAGICRRLCFGLYLCRIAVYPLSEKPEGEMSKMRSSLVCETALAEYAALIDLGSFLLLGHGEDTAGGESVRRRYRTHLKP